ncbi:MAG: riboflavin synthase [Candidatus Omnitrophica bacterium]|nr:riboflavin synthase [Candidatus Omnitrophota bacterium]MCM8793618.1 riboflavin synthase [Candidatus Omnitrophota bacterium]
MFTGIIEELGYVDKISREGGSLRLEIKAEKITSELKIGESVSVNGVCLTIVGIKKDNLIFDCMEETIKCTNLGLLRLREKVNLEKALRPNSLLSGHIVLGHVDGMGKISKKIKKATAVVLSVEANKEILDYLVPKGSIALDGVSLTLGEIGRNYFSVNLIPHTLKTTTLGFKDVNDYLNIEIDILAKYMRKFLLKEDNSLTEDFLKEHGFLL